MAQGRLFPADETPLPTTEEPVRVGPALFGNVATAAQSAAATTPMTQTPLFVDSGQAPSSGRGHAADSSLFGGAEEASDTHPVIVPDEPPMTAAEHAARGYSGLPRPRRVGRLIGMATAVVAVAALGAATLFFLTRPPVDALGPLRDIERSIYSDERSLTRAQTAAQTDVDNALAATELATSTAESLRGLIPDADVDYLASAAGAVTSALKSWEALDAPDPYKRDIPADADEATVASAVAAAEKAREAVEQSLAAAKSTHTTLALRLEALDLAADRAADALVAAADAALAKEEPAVDESFRAALTAPLDQFRPLTAGGVEALPYVAAVADPLRALTTEQARLEDEEAERQRLLEEERERERNRYVPAQPVAPVNPAPVDPDPVDPTPVDPTPVDPVDPGTAPETNAGG